MIENEPINYYIFFMCETKNNYFWGGNTFLWKGLKK